MTESSKKFVLREATRKRCKIVKTSEKLLKRFMPISLEMFPYLREAKAIDFSIYFHNDDEMVEFIKPNELSGELLASMVKAVQKPGASVEICLLKSDYAKFEAVISAVRDKKIRAVIEKDPTLDSKVIEVYSTLSSASQMIVRGGITNLVAGKATSATAHLMSTQMNSEVAVGTLSRMINCDSTLYDHSASVAMLAAVIATSFLKKPLDKKESAVIAQCGLYHDAGKSCVPNHVLNKPGLFTPEEFEIMKTHTIHGHQELQKAIKRGAPIHDLAARVAFEHHERFTGKGYPEKKAGRLEESENGIHLYTRIVSIADVYSALLMKRVYKESLSSLEAITLMAKVADNDFDPEIFNPFYDHIMKSIEVFKQREKEYKENYGSVKMIDEKDSFGKAIAENQSSNRKQVKKKTG